MFFIDSSIPVERIRLQTEEGISCVPWWHTVIAAHWQGNREDRMSRSNTPYRSSHAVSPGIANGPLVSPGPPLFRHRQSHCWQQHLQPYYAPTAPGKVAAGTRGEGNADQFRKEVLGLHWHKHRPAGPVMAALGQS